MDCDLYRAWIDAALDGELPSEESARLDAHLRDCSSCAADALARAQSKRAIRSAGRRHVPAPEFRQQVLEKIQPRKKLPWVWQWSPQIAVAATVLMVVVGLLYRSRATGRQEPLAELADMHVSTLASSNPVDVLSSDRHTVKPWFQGKLPFTFDLPELGNSPYRLIGGRMAYVQQQPAAHLLFQYQQHLISVFVFQDRPDFAADRAGTFNMETWNTGGLRFVMIGDAAPDVLRGLVPLLKAAASR
jgi:anti-sigma factor RsiW